MVLSACAGVAPSGCDGHAEAPRRWVPASKVYWKIQTMSNSETRRPRKHPPF